MFNVSRILSVIKNKCVFFVKQDTKPREQSLYFCADEKKGVIL